MRSAAARSRPSETQWIEVRSEAEQLDFGQAVRDGLAGPTKTLPSQFFYDDEGSRLFEEICSLPEYYLTRAETEILDRHADELASRLPNVKAIVELGSGSALKTEFLLRAFGDRIDDLCYAPIDVSRLALEESVDRLEQDHPELLIRPAIAEYEAGLAELARLSLGPTLTLWLGSSIGNLDRTDAAAFLGQVSRTMRPADRLLVGIDLRKARNVLEAAYNDSAGVTARFDLNLLARINAELGGQFDLDRFEHVAHYDETSGSVQSFLASRDAQSVVIRDIGVEVEFEAGERIHTENSHKYSLEEIDALAEEAGLRLEHRYFDADRRFTLNLFALPA